MARRRLPARVRFALLAGIRGNLPALEAALATGRKDPADETIDLGNAVGPGPHPAEVAALLAKRRIDGVLGAFEAAAFADAHVPRSFFADDAGRVSWEDALEFARARVPAGERRRLAARPATRRLVADGRRILLAHGSAASPFERVASDAPDSLLVRHLAAARADVLVLGAGGPPAARRVGEGLVVWAGSIGRSLDARGRRVGEATWCVLDTAEWVVEPRSAAFDLAAVERDTLKTGAPDPAV